MEEILLILKANLKIIIPVIMFSVVVIIGIIAYYFSNKRKILREFKKSRKKQINSVKEKEYVKIIGKTKPINEYLEAPLSGRKCVYYHVIVEVKANKNWRKIINEEMYQDFYCISVNTNNL